MVERTGAILRVTAPMMYANAASLRRAGSAHLSSELAEIDLGAVSDADSAALAVLFAWLREARASSPGLRISNPPPGLISLATLYGVDEFLPLA
jgi:phospholipid transport system transporter-binding protein